MGYNVLVTRKKNWFEPESGEDITPEEWRAFAESHPELELDPDPHRPVCAYRRGTEDWVQWCDGSLETKNPDAALMALLAEIAAGLRAKVQGEEGEVYLPNGEQVRDGSPAVKPYPGWLFPVLLMVSATFGFVLGMLVKR